MQIYEYKFSNMSTNTVITYGFDIDGVVIPLICDYTNINYGPVSPYIIFCKNNRQQIKNAYNNTLTFAQVAKTLGTIWKNIPDDFMEHFVNLSKINKIKSHNVNINGSNVELICDYTKIDFKAKSSPYLIFCNQNRQKIRDAYNDKLTFGELGEVCRSLWNEIPSDFRENFMSFAYYKSILDK